MTKYRFDGKLKLGPPVYAAIACDLVGAALLAVGIFLVAGTAQKIAACTIGVALLVISSCLMFWQVLKNARKVADHRWR